MTLKRYVFDTNVLISAVLLSHSQAQLAFDYALDTGYLLASEETLLEFREVLSRPKFERYKSLSERLSFLEIFVQCVQVVNIVEKITNCRDPKDNKFLEVAVNGKANAIITGDNDLLILHPFREIKILSINQFLANRFNY